MRNFIVKAEYYDPYLKSWESRQKASRMEVALKRAVEAFRAAQFRGRPIKGEIVFRVTDMGKSISTPIGIDKGSVDAI